MATERQREAARQNVKKAQATWQGMSFRQHSAVHPQGNSRAKPGTAASGQYYRIMVRPKEHFTTFRYQDVGEPGGLKRLAGRRSNGSWGTQSWLISKDYAHIEDDKLVADHPQAHDLLRQLGGDPVREKGDVFHAKDC